MSDESGMVGATVGRLMILLRKYHGAWNGRAPLQSRFQAQRRPFIVLLGLADPRRAQETKLAGRSDSPEGASGSGVRVENDHSRSHAPDLARVDSGL